MTFARPVPLPSARGRAMAASFALVVPLHTLRPSFRRPPLRCCKGGALCLLRPKPSLHRAEPSPDQTAWPFMREVRLPSSLLGPACLSVIK